MAMAVSSGSCLLPLRRSPSQSLFHVRPAQIRSQWALPRGRIFSCRGRRVSERNLVVRAGEGDEGEDQDSQRLEDLEARLGLGRKGRREGGGAVEAPPAPSPKPKPKAAPKPWGDMSLPEKAWAAYIGEEGVLFWLNKLAYAAIFVIIGGWIVFRFIGPALGWYELDSPLLPPGEVLSGTAGR